MADQMVSIREAKARLSELAGRAADGADIVIAKHGRPEARLVSARPARRRVDLATLQALVKRTPRQPESGGQALRRLRDDSRY